MKAIRLDGRVVYLRPITRPCSDRDCDHPLMCVRTDTERVITVPSSLTVSVS